MTERIASIHLAEFPLRRCLSRMVVLAAERWELPETEGCVLGKVLGTSKKGTTKTSVDLRRWVIFAVWENSEAYESFMANSTVMNRWRSQSSSLHTYKLTPLKSRGEWGGVDPFPELTPTESTGRLAIVTRAAVRKRRLITFSKAVPRVDDALWRQPGCESALGMGEWPVGQQATFSIWDSYESVRKFAQEGVEHSEVIKRTYNEHWYSEELFARFKVSEG